MSPCDDQDWACQVIVSHGKNLKAAIFSHIINMINVKLCTILLLVQFYMFIPLPVTLTIFQGHSSVKLF